MKLSVSNGTEGNLTIAFVGEGTYDSKDAIKELGYKYGECYIHLSYEEKVWNEEIKDFRKNVKELFDELVKVQNKFGNMDVDWMGHELTLDKIIATSPFNK